MKKELNPKLVILVVVVVAVLAGFLFFKKAKGRPAARMIPGQGLQTEEGTVTPRQGDQRRGTPSSSQGQQPQQRRGR